MELRLDDSKVNYERQAYSFFQLLGDFGGFNDALIFLVGNFTALYGSRMFSASIASTLPTEKRENRHQENEEILLGKIDNDTEFVLQREDIKVIKKSIKATKVYEETPFWKALCYMRYFCKKDEHMRLQ